MQEIFYDYFYELEDIDEGDERFLAFIPEDYEFRAYFDECCGNGFNYYSPVGSTGAYQDNNLVVCDHICLSALWTTYWNWRNLSQQLVGFEICGFNNDDIELSEAVLDEVDARLESIPYLEIRNSVERGRQVISHLEEPIRITSKEQSKALRASVVNLVAQESGYDFNGHITDFVYDEVQIYESHCTTETAFQVLKPATEVLPLSELSLDWRVPALKLIC